MIRCYGSIQQSVGAARVEMNLEVGADVSNALDRLIEEHTELESTIEDQHALVIMRDGQHLDLSTELAADDVLNISMSPMRD